jgi:hypothetical protein
MADILTTKFDHFAIAMNRGVIIFPTVLTQ